LFSSFACIVFYKNVHKYPFSIRVIIPKLQFENSFYYEKYAIDRNGSIREKNDKSSYAGYRTLFLRKSAYEEWDQVLNHQPLADDFNWTVLKQEISKVFESSDHFADSISYE